MRDKKKEFKRNLIAVAAILVSGSMIGSLLNIITAGSKATAIDKKYPFGHMVTETLSQLGVAGFIREAKDFFISVDKENILKSYQEKYPDNWVQRLKEDFKDEVEAIYKAAYGREYGQKMKEDIIKAYKTKYGDKYRVKLKEDYKNDIIDYYKRHFGSKYEERLKEDIVSEYKKEFQERYKDKLKEELKEDVVDYYQKEYGEGYEEVFKKDYEKYK